MYPVSEKVKWQYTMPCHTDIEWGSGAHVVLSRQWAHNKRRTHLFHDIREPFAYRPVLINRPRIRMESWVSRGCTRENFTSQPPHQPGRASIVTDPRCEARALDAFIHNISKSQTDFYRVSACYACKAPYFSPILSVCPSHCGIVSKRMHISSYFSAIW